MNHAFSAYHPVVNFTFFTLAVLFSVLFLNPVMLAVALPAAFLYSLLLKGRHALKFGFVFALPMMLVIAVVNPLFVHQGFTVLFYLNDNPVTLESLIYGAAASATLVTVLLWFVCYNEIVTTDKFLFLFARLIPSLSLLISMTLRLIPRLRRQTIVISQAQRGIGMDASTGGVRQRARHGMKIFSVLMLWALENGLETADSMKARGYGLGRRSSFSLFRFTVRDAVFLAVLACAASLCLAGYGTGAVSFQFYPLLRWAPFSPMFAVTLSAYAAFCFLPCAVTVWEEIKWHFSLSKI